MSDTLPEPYCRAHNDADCLYPGMFTADQMRDYASAAVAAERERCAALCQSKSANGNFRADTRDECAALIRGEY